MWAVRIYKTRGLSAEAIKGGRVQINGLAAKPAHTVKPGEIATARLNQGAQAWTRTMRVLGDPPSRVAAKLVALFAEELTPPEEFEKSRVREEPGMRERGAGRPTKRERRETDEWLAGE